MQDAGGMSAPAPPPDPAAPSAAFSLALPTPAATIRLAERLAPCLRAGDCLALWGDLGVGKTAFARALIRALDPAVREVPSPTFTLVQTYDTLSFPVFHFDLYRLASPDEVWELGWEEALSGVCLIEWPERLGPLLPRRRLDLRLEYATQEDARHLRVEDRMGPGPDGAPGRFSSLKELDFDKDG